LALKREGFHALTGVAIYPRPFGPAVSGNETVAVSNPFVQGPAMSASFGSLPCRGLQLFYFDGQANKLAMLTFK